MPTFKHLISLVAIGCFAIQFAGAAEPITLESLLPDMIDLKSLSEFPEPAYTCKQFSSYDRKSVSPTEENWFANADAGQYLRVEEREGRKEYVMMDAAGPGAVARIWSANPGGTLRIYLDGAEKPVLAARMDALLGGRVEGIPSPLAGVRGLGWNLYFPIPYAKHCKITSDSGNFYYHVGYRTYPAGTKVVTFSMDQLPPLARKINELADRLNSPRLGGGPPADRQRSAMKAKVDAGRTETLAELTGGGAICELHFDVKELNARALREVILKITFDGQKTVEVPLGDFFGSAPGVNPYAALPLGMTHNKELWSHWYMPFRDTAKIEVTNLGLRSARFSGSVATVAYAWTERSMYFHAGWRIEIDAPVRPFRDWNYLTAKGKGVFAGAAMNIANRTKIWWGEGDEKIYVDGETFPSHFGTGTEDYYSYAWCCWDLFSHAYHNQPRCDGPKNYGQTSVNRFHILDRIPFTTDFRFDMELWSHNPLPVDMAVTTYWYARPGGTDEYQPIKREDTWMALLPAYRTWYPAGIIEVEEMTVRSRKGIADPREIDAASQGYVREWQNDLRRGDRLDLAFTLVEGGTCRAFVRMFKENDNGALQFLLNGEKAGPLVDSYKPSKGKEPMEEVELGTFKLPKGENILSWVVAEDQSSPHETYEFLVDYLRLEPAK